MTIGVKNGVLVFRCANVQSSLSMRKWNFSVAIRHIDNRTFLWLFSHLLQLAELHADFDFPLHWARQNAVSAWVTLVREATAVYLRNTPVVLRVTERGRYADGVGLGPPRSNGRGDPFRGIRNKHVKKILMLLMAEQKSKLNSRSRVIGSESCSPANGNPDRLCRMLLNLDKISNEAGNLNGVLWWNGKSTQQRRVCTLG
ncbi:hypothetical protein BV898_19026 [Hypsibius exemplaris]|uniref:Uncharacterized protein n=1 Tax=Hypsibius exemplaris TaxID=2072580 RepID=A0A9X6NIB8_HYPEX|nr:hypothetical protein BV898_19026 [Hypsibius exemplaris]